MKAYLAVKYHEDLKNRQLIEEISKLLKDQQIDCVVMIRDHEKWGQKYFSPPELMNLTFQEIRSSDLVIVEFSEKGVGLGIESGYAKALDKPIVIFARKESEISTTMAGIADQIIIYQDTHDLQKQISNFNWKNLLK